MVRWGIIGCGNVTEVKSGPAFQNAQDSKLVAVMRRDGDLARDYALRHGVPKWYDHAQALISDPEVDAVYVATPVGSHEQMAQAVAAAGKPAYVEKPMARHAPECERMVRAFETAGVPLFVAYYRRCLPRFQRVQELLARGAVGRLTALRYHYGSPSHAKAMDPLPWRLCARDSGGGLFLDLGCHALDILDFLFGPLRAVQGVAHNVASHHDVEDTVSMVFEVGDGVSGVASWNFASHERVDILEVDGTEGSLGLSVFGDTPIQVSRLGRVEELSVSNPHHIQQPLVQSIVDELMGRGCCPSTGQSAMRTTVVMDGVLSGYYGGRDDAFWERASSWPGRRSRDGARS
jgi:predicted dehydrogenase